MLAVSSIDTAQSMMCAIDGIHNGLKIVFCLGMLHPPIIMMMLNCLLELNTLGEKIRKE